MGLTAIIKGWTGELKTKFINYLFLDENYKVFNDVIIRDDRGSTQIDHVVVSKFGIFTIETKDKTGWIFGDADQDEWTQVIFNNKIKFQNPLRQNYRHTKALAEFLGIEHTKIHSIIVFWADCEFKSQMPENVFKGGIFDSKYRRYIQSKTETLLTTDEILKIHSSLSSAKEQAGFLGDLRHTMELKNKYSSSTICPKCGGNLVKRISKGGPRVGQSFLGCVNYPRCHYIKEL